LESLISELTLPPNLATTILDTDVGEPWIPVITDFERRFEGLKVRGRVRAARDLSEVAEGLRIVVRPFLNDANSLIIQSRWANFSGGHETARFFPRSATPDPRQHDHKHAHRANNRFSQVPFSVRVFASTRHQCGHGSTKGLHRYRTRILRNWISPVHEKSWLDQGQ
jgi:hypothetical protein